MLFYARKVGDKFELVTFSDTDKRPVPCPFRRLAGESKIKRETRRIAHNLALYSAGYSAREYKGRTEIQARLSERFEDTHFNKRIDENSVYLVEHTPGISFNTTAWTPIRYVLNAGKTLVNKAASFVNFVNQKMTGNEPVFEIPRRLQNQCQYTGKYTIQPDKASTTEETKMAAEASSTPTVAAHRPTSQSSAPASTSEKAPLLHKYPSSTSSASNTQLGEPLRKRRPSQ